MIEGKTHPITLVNLSTRKPRGFGVSPYPFKRLIRYILNTLFNGFFSYKNPDLKKLKRLHTEGKIAKGGVSGEQLSSIKVLFLGDVMVSRTGKPPALTEDLKRLLGSADVIVANIESPLVEKEEQSGRGLSLKFSMNPAYLKEIVACNQTAQWVFSLGNNHACDTSMKDDRDVSGIKASIQAIKNHFPRVSIIGAELEGASAL